MDNIAIRVDCISKQYKIGVTKQAYYTLRDCLSEGIKSLFQRNSKESSHEKANTIWALRNVSFEVKRGEVLGIIGRNGAGKSTLLKILSRIVAPTDGIAAIYGRVGALLEVGTGFHGELTGRENIYLNGAILGMKRAEIKDKFDEIVAFAEIEKFIDTPVKRYSSGMYTRLAFAVAAHLDPDILIVDEVLAVGDATFQKKCLGKMSEVTKEGRTVFLVSHNMMAIAQLCHMCLWLDNGQVKKIGAAHEVVSEYSSALISEAEGTFSPEKVKGDGQVEFLSYRVVNQAGQDSPLPLTNEDVIIHIRLKVVEPINQPVCAIEIWNSHGVMMLSINTADQGEILERFPAGELNLTIRLGKIPFMPDVYTASVVVMNSHFHWHAIAEHAICFEIGQSPLYGTSVTDHRWGCVYTKVDFIPDVHVNGAR
ncbi:MAG TPA: ABC transporter ATP-binding protein [Candidatus Eisenbacteria bacterium]|nr:ABC transporter ATP-binding protein [Candidatus Eisenbacteria bacterium]